MPIKSLTWTSVFVDTKFQGLRLNSSPTWILIQEGQYFPSSLSQSSFLGTPLTGSTKWHQWRKGREISILILPSSSCAALQCASSQIAPGKHSFLKGYCKASNRNFQAEFYKLLSCLPWLSPSHPPKFKIPQSCCPLLGRWLNPLFLVLALFCTFLVPQWYLGIST